MSSAYISSSLPTYMAIPPKPPKLCRYTHWTEEDINNIELPKDAKIIFCDDYTLIAADVHSICHKKLELMLNNKWQMK